MTDRTTERTMTMSLDVDRKTATHDPGAQRRTQRRAAGALLMAGPIVFLLTELVSAAAWRRPAYSYTYDFISDLGVRGPSTLFGQYMYSPLAWLMNLGFFSFGITILAGVVLLRGLTGWRRPLVVAAAALLAVGGVLVSLFHGSGEALEDGTGQYHALGAFVAFISANVLALLLGRLHQRLGLSRAVGGALLTVGVIGLLSTVLYLVAIVSPGDSFVGVIGLVERGATHPFLIGLLCAGVSIWNCRTHDLPAPTSTETGATR